MTLLRFRDNTHSEPYIVAARDLLRALELKRRSVDLRRADGTTFVDDTDPSHDRFAACILLSSIPDAVVQQARAILGDELPDLCVAVLQPQDALIGIRRGERGYYPMYEGTIIGTAARIVADRMNDALKVAPHQREAMLVGSMMGWDCPGARPSSPLHAQAVRYTEEEPAS